MLKITSSSDIRQYAIAGAKARLLQLSQETETIHRLFPELRNGAARKAESASAAAPRRQDRRPRRRAMSAAERNAVSERMKKYWAAKRGGGDAAEPISSAPAATTAKNADGAAKRGKRTMSPEARKRISDAQKARWAKQRGEAKATQRLSASETSLPARGSRAAKRPRQGAAKRGSHKMSAATSKRRSQTQNN